MTIRRLVWHVLWIAVMTFGAVTPVMSAEVNLASVTWPPFSDEPDASRFAIDLVHEALSRAGYEAATSIVPAGELTRELRLGKYAGSPALWRSTDREAFMLFSDPYLENRLILVGRKGTAVDAASLGALTGKKVAIIEGYAYGEELDNAKDVTFVAGRDHQQSLERLLGEEVDFMLVDELLMQYVLQHQATEAEQYLAIGTTPLISRSLHFAVRMDAKEARLMIEAFNEELQDMIGDGTYNRILGLAWIRADVDGDGGLELIAGSRAGTSAPLRTYQVLPEASRRTLESTTPDRFMIEGRLFETWEEIPDEYKLPTVWSAEDTETILLFDFGID
ncbi:MAG: transporter substrate-binding domain-containing protein [Acidobacteriota bacterium]